MNLHMFALNWLIGSLTLLVAFEHTFDATELAQDDGEQSIRSTAFGQWTVRETREYVGDPQRRAVPFRSRYYLGKLDSDEESLAYEMTGTYAKQVKTVLNNGTLVLTYGNSVTWVRRDGSTRSVRLVIDGRPMKVEKCWPDFAVLAKEHRDSQGTLLYALPLSEEGEFDMSEMVQLTDDEGVWYSRGFLERRENRLAWLEYSPDENGQKFGKCAIATFEFDSSLLNKMPFDEYGIDMPDGAQIKEFDARLITIHDSRRRFYQVFDLNEREVVIDGFDLRTVGHHDGRWIATYWKAQGGARAEMREYVLCSIDPESLQHVCQILWSKSLSRFASVDFKMLADKVEISQGRSVETINLRD